MYHETEFAPRDTHDRWGRPITLSPADAAATHPCRIGRLFPEQLEHVWVPMRTKDPHPDLSEPCGVPGCGVGIEYHRGGPERVRAKWEARNQR